MAQAQGGYEDPGQFLDGVFAASLPHIEDAAPIYVWHAYVHQPTIAAAFERHGLLLHRVLVRLKPCATFGHSYDRWKHEPCAFGWPVLDSKDGNESARGRGQLQTRERPTATASERTNSQLS